MNDNPQLKENQITNMNQVITLQYKWLSRQ